MRPPRGPEGAADQLEAIRRGAVEIVTEADLRRKLAERRPLVIKAGFDPTAPDLHLGHTVLLRKLRQFQDLGHRVVFLIGDATALVGDPSGQSRARRPMTWDEVDANAQTYEQQVSKLLRVDDPRLFQRRHNSSWFGRSGSVSRETFGIDQLVELTSRYTVARLLERDDFRKRMRAGQEVSVLELLYPLMQGYDSVKLTADVELGGTDQTFNLLVGRDLQRAYGQEPQVVITMPLLEGTDGVAKMSKSAGNHIGINEPPGEQFGKLMSIPDALIVKYFTLLTDVDAAQLARLAGDLKRRAVNPRDAKAELAQTVVAMYHGAEAASRARAEFSKVFSRREPPSEMKTVVLRANAAGKVDLIGLLLAEGLAKTKNEARRLLKQGALTLNGAPLLAPERPLAESTGVLQVGARRFRRLVAPGDSH
ncbi:MAG: tyrosine--tRNA ligase [Candidatus Omnitrophica bacterium]|nr:tyrosine--tRNA ligase [Candidatus Omnitrophota bacterium]